MLRYEVNNLSLKGETDLFKIHDGGRVVEFPDGTPKDFAQMVLDRIQDGRFLSPIEKRWNPDEKDRKKVIASLGSEDLLEKVQIFKSMASDTTVDSQRDRMSPSVLREMAKQYSAGRTVLYLHSPQFPIGATSNAQVSKSADDQNVHQLNVLFYVNKSANIPSGNVAEMMQLQVLKRTSIAMLAVPTRYVESRKATAGRKGYFLYDNPEGLFVKELSLVDMGANHNAVVQKTSSEESVYFTPIEPKTQVVKMDESKTLVLKSMGDKTLQLPENLFEIVKALDTQNVELSQKVSKLESTENERLGKIRSEFVTKSVALIKDASEDQKLMIQKEADLLTEELLTEKIKVLNTNALALSGGQLDVSGSGKETTGLKKSDTAGKEEDEPVTMSSLFSNAKI